MAPEVEQSKEGGYPCLSDWGNLSANSNEIQNAVSPFDDIGYLASSGIGSAMNSTTGRGQHQPALHSFGDLPTQPADGRPVPRRRSTKQEAALSEVKETALPELGRLEKNSSKMRAKSGDRSLAFSAVKNMFERQPGGDNLLEISKQSLGVAELVSRKTLKSTEDSSSEEIKGTSSSTELTKKNSKKKPVRSLSKMFSKKDITKENEKVAALQNENKNLDQENAILKQKITELAEMLAKTKVLNQWHSFEELANLSTEMCQIQSQLEQANRNVATVTAKLESTQRLVNAKERSLCNLDIVRNSQEKRIAMLEVKCLENGIDLDEEGKQEVPRLSNRSRTFLSNHSSHDSLSGESSFASIDSFNDDNGYSVSSLSGHDAKSTTPLPPRKLKRNRSSRTHPTLTHSMPLRRLKDSGDSKSIDNSLTKLNAMKSPGVRRRPKGGSVGGRNQTDKSLNSSSTHSTRRHQRSNSDVLWPPVNDGNEQGTTGSMKNGVIRNSLLDSRSEHSIAKRRQKRSVQHRKAISSSMDRAILGASMH